MKKNKLLKNTIILILGGMLTKILGFIVKILYTRYLKEEGISLITLVFPTYSLLLTLSSFALPLAVSKLIAKNEKRKSTIIFNSLYITLGIDILLILIVLLFSRYFSIFLLKDERCYYLIITLLINLPFVSITSILKAYFFGTENVLPISLSNISEEIIKTVLIIFLLPKLIVKGLLIGVVSYLFINIICEMCSFIVLYFFLPKKFNIKNLSYKYNHECVSDLLNICVPTASGRIISSIGYFFEPIIVCNLLLYKGFDKSFIHLNYGYFQGYAIAILTIPSFFLMALSSNIIPIVTKLHIKNQKSRIKKLIVKTIVSVLILSIIFSSILSLFGKRLMIILYKSSKGYRYLKQLCPFFILFYLENPLMSVLQAIDQEKKVFKITTSGIIVKNLCLVIFIISGVGFNSLIISEISNIIFVVTLCIYHLRKYFYHSSQSNKLSYLNKKRKTHS